VRLSRDGVPVVVHDATLQRTGSSKIAVAQLTAEQLAASGVGSWFNRAHPARARQEYALECVPTLEQVFQLVDQREAIVYVEIKADDKGSPDDLVSTVATLIKKCSFENRVVVVSFDLAAIAGIKQIDLSIRTGALFAPRHGAGAGLRAERILARAVDCGADELLLHKLIVRPSLVSHALSQNLRVVVWTADDTTWMMRGEKLGIHALITNNPGAFQRND
jgi:glycerophosphoryl diester phosphodiesterase